MKKLISIIVIFTILAVSLLYGVFASSEDATYKGASPWAVPELDKAAEYGLITDKIKDKMNAAITREEFAEIVVKLYERCTGRLATYSGLSVFSDTGNQEIFKAYNLKIVNGTDMQRRLFSPDRLANREQVAAMMFRAVKTIMPEADFSIDGAEKFSDEEYISGWALESVNFMVKNSFLKGGDGKISPQGTCTREMAVLVAARVFEKYSFANGEGSDESNYWEQIVVNDTEIPQEDYHIKGKDSSDYIFIAAERFKYAFKRPYAGNYTYPEVDVSGGSISINWRGEEDIVLKVDLKEGSTEAQVNGMSVDTGIAPYSESIKTFIPANLFIAALDMDVRTSSKGDTLFIQYKDDFPADTLVGTWSDVDADLFADFKDITTGTLSLSSFATSYMFKADGTYGLRMASVGGFNDTFIIQKGKYQIMGNTIMFYDIIETLYKGKPFKLMYEDKLVGEPQYGFIGNYDTQEGKIEIGGFWLNKR